MGSDTQPGLFRGMWDQQLKHQVLQGFQGIQGKEYTPMGGESQGGNF